MQILITGREQNLSIAEAESVFGDIKVINEQAIAVNQPELIDISKLGGSIKAASQICRLTNPDHAEIIEACYGQIITDAPQTKFNFGFSYYGKGRLNLQKLGIELKHKLQQSGLKPRHVVGTDNILNAASIKHNQLTNKGYDLLLVESGAEMYIARTTSVQDIDSYSKRDYDKPCRDSKVGMLPPKLSQILINLSGAKSTKLVVDPFCGSGGLLIEAALMGNDCEGSDISQTMVDCTQRNADWFRAEYSPAGQISIGGASDASLRSYPEANFVIATEGYLGNNYLKQPTLSEIEAQLPNLKDLYINFFKHLYDQHQQPDVIVVCVPFWTIKDKVVRLNIIDDVTELGYTKSEFKSVRSQTLDYHRQGQYTGRQILIFISNQEN